MNGLIMKNHWLLTVMLLLTALTAWSMSLSLPGLRLWEEKNMGISNGILIAPIGFNEPYSVLGVGKYNGWYDEGHICSNAHGKTNKWCRYKPVILNTKEVADTFNSTTKMWGEAKITTGGWRTPKPWFYGAKIDPVFEIKQITNMNEYGKDGAVNDAFMWKYNPPYGGTLSELRIMDFLGYNNTEGAACPLRVDMNDSIKFNSDFYAGISTDYEYGSMGGFDASEMVNFFNFDKLYVGIYIWNITKNYAAAYVKTTSITDDDSAGMFRLDPSSGDRIENGGFGHKMDLRDKVDVYLFFSDTPGADINSANYFSAYMDEGIIPYARYEVGYESIIVKVPYTCSNMQVNIIDLNKTMYINDYEMGGDGNYCTITRYISAVYGSLTVSRTANSDYSQFRVYLGGYGTVTNSSGESGTVQAAPPITYTTRTNGNFNYQDYSINLNGTEDMSFVAYNSLSDLQNGRNGVRYYGCPIYDSIILNNVDADLIGDVSKREIGIYCSGASSLDWHYLIFNGKNNIIYKD